MRFATPACSFAISILAATVVAAVHAAAAGPPGLTTGAFQAAVPAAQAQATNDIDAFMSRVLRRRDDTWRTLHDYILSETESFGIEGPGRLPLNGFKREYTWYVREGFLIRSPVRYDGVATPEAERRKYEDDWLKREKAREARASAKAERETAARASDQSAAADAGDVPSLESFVDQRGEPRFISEAYFLQFRFEPGNYYFAGRESLSGRDVLKIEYYPTELFGGDRQEGASASTAQAGDAKRRPRRPDPKEDEIERKLNKVALVTLWVDPAEYQIVKYTFDNTEFGFLPGRWLVRVGDVTASMTMSRVLDGVWLPGEITMQADIVLASGHYGFKYSRSFYDYRKAEVAAKVRMRVPEGE